MSGCDENGFPLDPRHPWNRDTRSIEQKCMKGKTAHRPTTKWDVGLSQGAQEFFSGEMERSRLTGAPMDFEQMKMPLADVAEMARQALVALSGWNVSDFQTVSDCGHLGWLLPEAASSPLYGKAILAVLSRCLHTAGEIDGYLEFGDEGCPAVIADLLAEQIGMLRHVDDLTLERWGPERVINQLLPDATRGGKVLDGARAGHMVVHGDDEAKRQRRERYQEAVESKQRANPAISLTEARRRVAADFKVAYKTIVRNTQRP